MIQVEYKNYFLNNSAIASLFLGTQMRSHGLGAELNMLSSQLVFSPIRKRLLPIWRFATYIWFQLFLLNYGMWYLHKLSYHSFHCWDCFILFEFLILGFQSSFDLCFWAFWRIGSNMLLILQLCGIWNVVILTYRMWLVGYISVKIVFVTGWLWWG